MWFSLLVVLAALGIACTGPDSETRTVLSANPPMPTPAACPAVVDVPQDPGIEPLRVLVEKAYEEAQRLQSDAVLRGFLIAVPPPAVAPASLPITIYFAGHRQSQDPPLIYVREENGVMQANAAKADGSFPHEVDLSELTQGPESAVTILTAGLPEHTLVSIAAMNQGCGAIWAFQAYRRLETGTEHLYGRLLADGTIEEVSRSNAGRP